MKKTTITLAEQEFEIDQLSIGQLEDLAVGVVLPYPEEIQAKVRDSYVRCYEVLATALRIKYPELTVEALRAMQITRPELMKANDEVLVFSGMVVATVEKLEEGAPPGEGAAEAPEA